MDYGFFLPSNAGGLAQLWMTVIDVSKLAQAGADPSRPPVWLPFQDVAEHSYLGWWAERIACDAGGASPSACGDQQICDGGACAMVKP